MYEVVQVLGVDINISRMEQALSEVEALLTGGGRHYVCFMEANMMHCLLAAPDEIAPVLNGAALCYPDGVAVARSAALRLGQPVERVSGPSFVLRACAHGVERGWRHYFVGGGEGVAEALARKLQEQYPGLQEGGDAARRVAGDNPFTLKDCQADFLNQLHTVGNGFIRKIVIQDGLPIRFEIEKALNAI